MNSAIPLPASTQAAFGLFCRNRARRRAPPSPQGGCIAPGGPKRSQNQRMRAILCSVALAAALAAAEAARPAAAIHLADEGAAEAGCAAGENCSPFVNVTLYGEALCPYT